MSYAFDANTAYTKNGRKYVLCRCIKCGHQKERRLDHVKRNHQPQCNCTNHWMTNKRVYAIWSSMLSRCQNKNNHAYYRYGGRGINVCSKWHTFLGFWEDMKDGYKENLTLDRVDNNKGYSKENCRWATHHEQARNTRRNVWIEHNGERLIAADWCKKLGLSYAAVRTKVYKGKTYKQALRLD